MKLKKVHVREFKSIVNSGEFDITDITCLVGKNEAGKTAILSALYKLNPIIPEHGRFDVTEHYPRAYIGDYILEVEEKRREHAKVIEACFALDNEERESIEKEFGPGCLRGVDRHLTLSKGYSNTLTVTVDYDEPQIVKNILAGMEFSSEEAKLEAEQTTTIRA